MLFRFSDFVAFANFLFSICKLWINISDGVADFLSLANRFRFQARGLKGRSALELQVLLRPEQELLDAWNTATNEILENFENVERLERTDAQVVRWFWWLVDWKLKSVQGKMSEQLDALMNFKQDLSLRLEV